MSRENPALPPPWRTRQRLLRGLLVAEALLLAGAVATRLPGLWRERWVQDDAYISFRYAKHWVEGHGLVYNQGDYVEGYTNFLWTVLAALPLRLGAADPIDFLHQTALVLWLGTYALWLGIAIRLYRDNVWSAPLAALPLLFHYSFNQWFLSGMETPLVSFLCVAALYFLCTGSAPRAPTLFCASLCGVGLALARSDGMLSLGLLAIGGALGHRVAGNDMPARTAPEVRARRWIWALLPLWLLVPFHLWRLAYYGSFYPNTYYAKAAYLTHYDRGWEYLSTFLRIYPAAGLTPLLIAAAWIARGATRRLLVTVSCLALGIAFYLIRLGGDFMEWRFLTPIVGVVYPSLVLAADRAAARVFRARHDHGQNDPELPWRSHLAGAVGGGIAAVALAWLTHAATPRAQSLAMPGQETIPLLARYTDRARFDWGEVGRQLDRILPPQVTIATTSAGIIPYFCDRRCLDLHGLTDAHIAQIPVDPAQRGRVGHDHWLQDFDEIRARGAHIVIPFAIPKAYPLALVTPPTAKREMVSVRLPNQSYVDIEILNPHGWDRASLRQDDRLVFYGDAPAAPRDKMQTLASPYAAHQIVATFDLAEDDADAAHEFEEIFAPGAPSVANFHDKMLRYEDRDPAIAVHDNGRILDHRARWVVDHIDPAYDLAVVARYDRTGAGVYGLLVNGREVPGELRFASGPEAWDERALVVPATSLLPGRNLFELYRKSDQSTELYFFWFLQHSREETRQRQEPDPRGGSE